jgi:alpha-beta hydrolase superfamily lysophospholipase
LSAADWTLETFTAGDGYPWHYRRYQPVGPSRSRVVCLHGIQSHAGWYEHSCRRLAGGGYEVFFLDRRGSGTNSVARGDAPSFRRLLDDVAEFLQTLRGTSAPALPLFLLAVSWGSKLATALQKRRPGLVDGIALLCPGFCPKVRVPLRERLAILWARLTNPGRLFPVPLDEPELFTATPRWLDFLRHDPLSLHEATARFLIESVRLDWYLKVVPRHVHVPVILMLAGRDRIIDNARTRAFLDRFAATDKEIIEYPEAHHTLEFESDPDRPLDDLLAWLDHHRDALPQARASGP